jgi:hypothetical protein
MLFNHNVCAASDPSVKRHVLSKHELYQNNHHIQTNQRDCKGGIMANISARATGWAANGGPGVVVLSRGSPRINLAAWSRPAT